MISHRFRFFTSLLLLFFASGIRAQTFEIDTIKWSGPVDKRVNFVFLSDGYQETELDSFRSHVENILPQLFATPPFDRYKEYFNVVAIRVPSNESGASHPGTAFDEPGGLPIGPVDNYFGSAFDVNSIHRLLVPLKGSQVTTTLFNNFPECHQAFILVNTSLYGGSGGEFATSSIDPSAGEIAIHEIGHSFGSLGDEYGGGTPYPGYETWNTTSQKDRDSIRWKNWIDATTPIPTPIEHFDKVGLFEGASYHDTGWYRPRLSCKMRSLYQPFCEVCTEAFVERIHEITSAIDGYAPSASKPVSVLDTLVFNIRLLGPTPNTLAVRWYLDGADLNNPDTSFILAASLLDEQPHEVVVAVEDTTSLVRRDTHSGHIDEVRWTVKRSTLGIEAHATEARVRLRMRQTGPGRIAIEVEGRTGAASTIQITDAVGRVLLSTSLPESRGSTTTFETPELVSGTYSIAVIEGARTIFARTYSVVK